MIYSGTALIASILSSGIVNLTFDLDDSSVNKFNEKPARYIAKNVEIKPTGIVTAGMITPVRFPKNK